MADKKENDTISITEIQSRFRRKNCKHKHIIVDEALAEVVCKHCGVKLNPIWVLAMLSREESKLEILKKDTNLLLEKLEKKQRTKCQHCGKFTQVKSS